MKVRARLIIPWLMPLAAGCSAGTEENPDGAQRGTEQGLRTCDVKDAPDLERCDLRNMVLSNLDLSDADLRGADLSDSQLLFTNLQRADLTGASLKGCLLWVTDFTDANLTGADLTDANYRQPTFSNTICPDGSNSDNQGDNCPQ